VAILTFERLTRAPVATMGLLYDWLGVDGGAADVSGFDRAENVTPEVMRVAAWHGGLQHLRQYRPFRLLTACLPLGLRNRAVRLATRQVQRRSVDTSEVTAFLRPIQRLQTEALVRLVGREFPEWVTLYGEDAARSPLTGPETAELPFRRGTQHES
jgi:hypothetical protein